MLGRVLELPRPACLFSQPDSQIYTVKQALAITPEREASRGTADGAGQPSARVSHGTDE